MRTLPPAVPRNGPPWLWMCIRWTTCKCWTVPVPQPDCAAVCRSCGCPAGPRQRRAPGCDQRAGQARLSQAWLQPKEPPVKAAPPVRALPGRTVVAPPPGAKAPAAPVAPAPKPAPVAAPAVVPPSKPAVKPMDSGAKPPRLALSRSRETRSRADGKAHSAAGRARQLKSPRRSRPLPIRRTRRLAKIRTRRTKRRTKQSRRIRLETKPGQSRAAALSRSGPFCRWAAISLQAAALACDKRLP